MTRFALCLLAVSTVPLLTGISITETAGLKVAIENGELVLSEFDTASRYKGRKETGQKRFFLNRLWVAKVIGRGSNEPSFALWGIDVPDDAAITLELAPVLLPDRIVVGEVPSGAVELEKPQRYRLGETYGVGISGRVSWSTGYAGTGIPALLSQNFCVLQNKQGQDYVQLLDPGDECKPKRKWFGWFK